jgi:ketosteroid isomerase-like protein
MIRLYRFGLLAAVLLLGLVAAGPQPGTESDQTAEVAAITKISDSAYAVFKKAVATSDVDLLLSFFIDTSGVVMPDMNALQGLANIRKRAPLLMRVVGGGKMEITRESMRLHENGQLARDAGTFTVTRKLEDGSTWKFNGTQTLLWKKTAEGVWKLDRAFIGENLRPKR